jgi:GT2 family glycosyltransferase
MTGLMIVLYNSNILEAKTYNSFKDQDVKILVLDNSTKENNNANDCVNLPNVEYMTMNGNVGLSVAYNKGIEYFKGTDVEHVIICDDDSLLEDNFIEQLNLVKDKYDICVPIVKSTHNDVIYSPVNSGQPLKNVLIRLLKRKNDVHKIKKITAINSGIVVNMNVFNNYQYDEKIFLYFVDVNFFDDMHKLGFKIGVIDTVMKQEFSEFVSDYTTGTEVGIILRLNDAKVYYGKLSYILFKLTLLLSKVIHFKSLKPLKLMSEGKR